MVEIPYIGYNSDAGEYYLYFKIPINEYEKMKSHLSDVDKKAFGKFAKTVCENHGIKTWDTYPELRWNMESGELEGLLMGIDCACVSKEKDRGAISYTFHNISGHDQALAALEILAKFYKGLAAP